MQSQDTQVSNTATNFKELRFRLIRIAVFTIPHTICWWLFEFYSDKLYAVMMAILFLIAAVVTLDYFGLKDRNYLRALVLGGFPIVLAWMLPKYTLLALCASFLCFWTTTTSISPKEIPYMVASNCFGWIGLHFYAQYWRLLEGYDEVDITYFKMFFDDKLHSYQLLLVFIICYGMSRSVVIEKEKNITARNNYEQKTSFT